MKIPLSPPKLDKISKQIGPRRLVELFFDGIGPAPDGKYRHWETLRRISPPEGLTSETWWLAIKLQGSKSNAFGVGARIQVKAGKLSHTRESVLSSSYLSCDSLISHFGLGDSATVDSVEVTWPSGTVSRLSNVPADQIVTVKEQN